MANTYSLEHNISFIYRNAKTGLYEEFLPKTVDSQVICVNNKTAHDHTTSDKHVNSFDYPVLSNMGKPNGLVILDKDGKIPLSNTDDSLLSIKIEYPNISTMLSQSSKVLPGAMVMVIDASEDSSVKTGWAVYRRRNYGSYNVLNSGWDKIAENESFDLETKWTSYDNRPVSSVENIDQAVRLKHSHDNKEEALDNFGTDDWGHLMYRDKKVAYISQVTFFHEGEYLLKDQQRLGDIWIKPSVGQTWWNDSNVPYAGTNCAEKYHDYDTMVTSPKLNTVDVLTMRRMFYRCYDLVNVQQYDVRKVTDFSGMFQECSSLETVPFLATYSGDNFDEMFYACVSLHHTPEIDLSNASTAKEFCNGCVNLVRVLPFVSTSNITNMKRMFNGCSALETIDSEIDFSSISLDDNVSDMFTDCQELKDLKVKENSIKVNISFSGTNLSKESITSILNGLGTLDSGTTKTLDIRGIDSVKEFEAKDFTSATNKGWSILKD